MPPASATITTASQVILLQPLPASSSTQLGNSSQPVRPTNPPQGTSLHPQHRILPAHHQAAQSHPPSAPSSTPQTFVEKVLKVTALVWKGIRTLDRTTLIVGLVIAALGVVPAWRGYVIAQWTARKEFVEYCHMHLNILVGSAESKCKKAIAKGVGPPPFVPMFTFKRHISQFSKRESTGSMMPVGHPNSTTESNIKSNRSPADLFSPVYPTSTYALAWIFVALSYLVLLQAMLNVLAAIMEAFGLSNRLQKTILMITQPILSLVGLSIGLMYFLSQSGALGLDVLSALEQYLAYCADVRPEEKDYAKCQLAMQAKSSPAPQRQLGPPGGFNWPIYAAGFGLLFSVVSLLHIVASRRVRSSLGHFRPIDYHLTSSDQ